MQKKFCIAITGSVWEDAGVPSKRSRETMLTHLRRLAPDLVVIEERRTWFYRYRVAKGDAWLAIENAAQRPRKNSKKENGV
jgi:hypothetical protein